MQQKRTFKQLNDADISNILEMHSLGMPKLHIAKKLGVDNNTIHYHINKNRFRNKKAVLHVCGHTSLKCLVCGMAHDNLRRAEAEIIDTLKTRIRELERLCEIKNDTI